MIYTATYDSPVLQHHGILGQKWGIRRFQNPDGTLTKAGKARYGLDKSNRSFDYEDGKLTEHGQAKIAKDALNLETSRGENYRPNEFYDAYNEDLDLDGLRNKMTDIFYSSYDETLDESKGTAFEQASSAGKEWISEKLGEYSQTSVTELNGLSGFRKFTSEDVIEDIVMRKAEEDAGDKAATIGTPNNHKTKALKNMSGEDDEFEAYSKLQKKVENESVDWYFGKPKSDAMKKLYAENSNPSRKEVLTQVLKDIGEPVTQDNLDAIEDVVFWD